MEILICYCLKCKSELGRFKNTWNGIGNTYISPTLEPISGAGLKTTGDTYEAARGSTIQFSLLRDLACTGCKAILGLRCDQAPEGHVLKQDQFILRLKEMSIISEESGKPAKVSIIKTVPLTNNMHSRRRASAVRQSFLPLVPSLATETTMIPNYGEILSEQPYSGKMSLIKSSLQTETASDLERLAPRPEIQIGIEIKNFKAWADSMIQDQRKDIDRISEKVVRIEEEMQMTKIFLQEIRADLVESRQNSDYDKKLTEVRKEIKRVDEKVNQKEETPEWNKAASLLARNLKTIAIDLKELSAKVGGVDELILAHEVLAGRLQRLEEQNIAKNGIYYPTNLKEVSEENYSKKRTRNSAEVNQNPNGSKSSPLSSIKKRCLDESLRPVVNVENLETNVRTLKPGVVDLVSPGRRSCILKRDKHESPFAQGYQPSQNKLLSHRKPQVLIRSSNFEVLPQKPGTLNQQHEGTISDPVTKSHKLPEINLGEIELEQRISDVALPNDRTNSNQLDVSDKYQGADVLTRNQDGKIDRRSLRARKLVLNNETNTGQSTEVTEEIFMDNSHVDHEDAVSTSEIDNHATTAVSSNSQPNEGNFSHRWQCNECKEVFRSPKFLDNHQKKSVECGKSEHKKWKPYACKMCGKRYKNAGSMKNTQASG